MQRLRRALGLVGLAWGLACAGLPPPAQALVLPRFGGFKGTPHATPHGSNAHEVPPGGAVHGGGPFEPPPRGVEPEWLRASREHLASPDELLQRQAEAAVHQANGGGDRYIDPWPAAPHLRVRVSGQSALDGLRLRRLADRLARPLDPQRLRIGSLADDMVADALLAEGLAPGVGRPEQVWLRGMRHMKTGRDASDPAALAALLRPLRGDVLLLMAHVDTAHREVAFKGADGKPRQVSVEALEQAAQDAEVQLLLVGCRSGRLAGVGFADNLNSLDAARVLLSVHRQRPDSMFSLFARLSSEHMTMLLDPQRFETLHQVDLREGADGPHLSTLHWLGWSAALPALAVAAGQVEAAASAAQPGAALASAWQRGGVRQALLALLLAVLASLTWGARLAWQGLASWRARGRWLLERTALHLMLPPLLLASLAEAIAGEDALWWTWGSLLVLVALGGWLLKAAWRQPRGAAGWLQVLRWLAVASPFFATAALAQTPAAQASEALLAVMRSLYALGRLLPSPWMLAGAVILVWYLGSLAVDTVQALRQGRAERRAHRARLSHMKAQLAAAGVAAPRQPAALAARLALDAELPGPVRWDQLERITTFTGPDPWSAREAQRWYVVRLPLPGPAAERQAWGLMRHESAFLHPLPQALVQRWDRQQVLSDELPLLLARVEPRLRRGDFVAPPPAPRPPLVLPLLGGLMACGTLWMLRDATGGERIAAWVIAATMTAAFILTPLLLWGRARWHRAWLLRVRAAPPNPAPHPPTAAA
ncbi:hypothetical protein BurJ1DRAFT_4841 [Burkholderiales bacterium JOSHI_001]|nr:hypothetical protein BurJ1DRAFT_4841 [Burkholderiales bacterium JOSHI_001]